MKKEQEFSCSFLSVITCFCEEILDIRGNNLYNDYTKNTGADCFSVCIGGDVYGSLI